MKFILHTQLAEQSSSITFRSVAAHLTELLFQFAGFYTVSFTEIRLSINSIPFMLNLPHFFVAHQHSIDNCNFIKSKLILRKHSQTFTRGDINRSFIRFYFSAEYFKKSRFTCPVCTDNTIAIPFCKVDINLIKKNPLAIRKSNIIYTDHNL